MTGSYRNICGLVIQFQVSSYNIYTGDKDMDNKNNDVWNDDEYIRAMDEWDDEDRYDGEIRETVDWEDGETV